MLLRSQMRSITSLPELDYQAEDVLCEIAQFDLHLVLSFLIGRLKHARALAEKKSTKWKPTVRIRLSRFHSPP